MCGCASLAGGCALFSGIFLIQAALSFFFLEGLEFTNIFTFGLNEHGKYPVDIYGKGILWVLTYIIPFALVQYYPLLYVLGRREEVRYALLRTMPGKASRPLAQISAREKDIRTME